jgi:hypothetical protein
MIVTEKLEWIQVYFMVGPTIFKQDIKDPPVNGWAHVFLFRGEKHSTLFCPYTLSAYQVRNDSSEMRGLKEPRDPFRRDYMVELMHKNWEQAQRFGTQKDFDTAAMVLKQLGAEIPHRIMTVFGEDTKQRGGKVVEETMKKPVKRKGKRGDFLAWWMEGDGMARPVREAMAHFGMTRSNVLSYLFILQKEHGIGYRLQGDLATIELPKGVLNPFDTEEGKKAA